MRALTGVMMVAGVAAMTCGWAPTNAGAANVSEDKIYTVMADQVSVRTDFKPTGRDVQKGELDGGFGPRYFHLEVGLRLFDMEGPRMLRRRDGDGVGLAVGGDG